MAGVNLEQFNYHLPEELVAQEVVHPQDHCRLMVVGMSVEHKRFYDIIDYLQEGDVLVVNQTKVRHAKLVGEKSTGAKVEVILTKPVGNNRWECRIKGGNLRVGVVLVFSTAQAKIVDRRDDVFSVEFDRAPGEVDLIVPTPPYVKKPVPERDYQTIFARREGSLAAPTAGLHFTSELVETIKRKGVKFACVTLHIGFGTFLPVKDLDSPKTEPEFYEVGKESADLINSAKRIVAVGTTSVKTLESATKNGKVVAGSGWSDVFIGPGYELKAPIAALVTNFHLPRSSLLMLACAFGGTQRVLEAYRVALEEKYRFYSLGDAMVIVR